jgi:hypothetical protein
MRLRLVTTTTALFATIALCGVAAADDDDTQKAGHENRGADATECAPASRVWIAGHYENRETSRVIPAITRQQWEPRRYEEVVVPAVTERVCVPAVTERVYCPEVTQRVWVPEVRERVWVPAQWDTRTDGNGCRYSVWMGAHYETRVREGRYETRAISTAHYETRVVRPEAWEVRIVQPERRETRVVEQGRFVTVVVRPERREVTVERVWVPGHWETRPSAPPPAHVGWIPPGHRK